MELGECKSRVAGRYSFPYLNGIRNFPQRAEIKASRLNTFKNKSGQFSGHMAVSSPTKPSKTSQESKRKKTEMHELFFLSGISIIT